VIEVESSLEVTTRETAQNALVWVDIFVSPVSPDYDMGAQGGHANSAAGQRSRVAAPGDRALADCGPGFESFARPLPMALL
jgi:hypothetical protein